MVPLGILTKILRPTNLAVGRMLVVLVLALVMGSAMLSLSRSLRLRRRWARPVGMAVLVAWTVAIGLFACGVAHDEHAGDGAGFAVLFGLAVGGFTLAGFLGLATRGSAADFRAQLTDQK